MKRMIATITALTALLCAFTGCGMDALDEVEDTASEETTELTEDETEVVVETSEAAAEEADEEESEEKAAVRETMETFAEAFNICDYVKVYRMSMPESWFDVIKVLERDPLMKQEEMDAFDLAEAFVRNLYGGYYGTGFMISDVTTIKEAPYADTYLSRVDYNKGKWIQEYITENGGVDEVDAEAFRKAFDEHPLAEFSDEVENVVSYRANFEYTFDSEIGYGDALVYSVDGGEWKIGEVHFKYQDTEQEDDREYEYSEEVGEIAESCEKQLGSFFSKNGIDIEEYENEWFIISSDTFKNYNVPEFIDVEEFVYRVNMDLYLINYDWFVVANGEKSVLAVFRDRDEELEYGTVPEVYSVLKIKNDGEYEIINSDDVSESTYDDIYEICLNEITKNK